VWMSLLTPLEAIFDETGLFGFEGEELEYLRNFREDEGIFETKMAAAADMRVLRIKMV
jgi:hypothetical protein